MCQGTAERRLSRLRHGALKKNQIMGPCVKRRPNVWNTEHISPHPPWFHQRVTMTQCEPVGLSHMEIFPSWSTAAVGAKLIKQTLYYQPHCFWWVSSLTSQRSSWKPHFILNIKLLFLRTQLRLTTATSSHICQRGTPGDICFSLLWRSRQVTLAEK